MANLSGWFFRDYLYGTDNSDCILDFGGDDVIHAFGGNDVIDAGSGNDRILGGTGADWMTGGSGSDIFVFAKGDGTAYWNADVITDFNRSQDQIEVIGGDAGSLVNFVARPFSSTTSRLLALVSSDGAGRHREEQYRLRLLYRWP